MSTSAILTSSTTTQSSPVRLLLLTALASAGLAAWGVASGLGAVGRPLADPDVTWVRHLVPAGLVVGLVVGLGLLGCATALLALTGGAQKLLAPVAALEVLALGLGLQSVSTISLAGYLLAMALPLGLVWLSVQVVRRYRRVRWLVLAAWAAVVTAGVASGALRPTHLAGLAGELGRGFAANAPKLVTAVLVAAAAACWVLVGVRLLRGSGALRRTGDWVLRHRRALTLVAAAGPLPYALVRASWLTPWPLLNPAGEALGPEMRLWGLLLGGGALLGCVLTVGLIRPWGRVFPRWMPWLSGRPVPVRAATVPGGLVAGLLTASALPMLWLTLAAEPGTVFSDLPWLDRLLALGLFPFGVWGPALALAVWAYARSHALEPAHAGD